jgi:hypothetical protein
LTSCTAITQGGGRCKGIAIDGSGICHARHPDRAGSRRRFASKGGKRGGRGATLRGPRGPQAGCSQGRRGRAIGRGPTRPRGRRSAGLQHASKGCQSRARHKGAASSLSRGSRSWRPSWSALPRKISSLSRSHTDHRLGSPSLPTSRRSCVQWPDSKAVHTYHPGTGCWKLPPFRPTLAGVKLPHGHRLRGCLRSYRGLVRALRCCNGRSIPPSTSPAPFIAELLPLSAAELP